MKGFAVKILWLLIVLGAAQGAIWRLGDNAALETFPNKQALDAYMEQNADLLCFIDSTNYHTAPNDRDARPTTQMMHRQLPEWTLGVLCNGAYHPEIHLAFIRYMLEKGFRPKAVILCLNMRSLSMEWDPNPAYQFERQRMILREGGLGSKIFRRPLVVFKAPGHDLHSIGQATYENMPVYDGAERIGTVRDFRGDRYKQVNEQNMIRMIRFLYMYPLPDDHRKILALREIGELLGRAGVPGIVYFTPIDYAFCEKVIGPRFTTKLGRNIGRIQSLLSDTSLDFLDLSFALDSPNFYWKNYFYPNEHLNETGRRFVAEKVATKVRQTLKKRANPGDEDDSSEK